MYSVGKQTGFTLIEMMSVVLLSGVLVAAATPLFNKYSYSRDIVKLQSGFAESVARARQAAVSSGTMAHVCASDDGLKCSGGDWSRGWLVYQSDDKKTSSAIPPARVIEFIASSDDALVLEVVDDQNQGLAAIHFDARGFSAANGRIYTTFSEPESGEVKEAWVIERTGRVRSAELPAAQQTKISLTSAY